MNDPLARKAFLTRSPPRQVTGTADMTRADLTCGSAKLTVADWAGLARPGSGDTGAGSPRPLPRGRIRVRAMRCPGPVLGTSSQVQKRRARNIVLRERADGTRA